MIGLLLALAACQPKEAPSPSAPAPPQTTGTLIADGLAAPVTVVRDRAGVPHLTAQSDDDLFFAQGFTQAQDRLFQMDLWRRSVQGRLSEVLGSNFIERDAMTRRIQFRGDASAEWASYGPDAHRIATAFTRGINAWIDASRDRWPDEFRLAGWTPEQWLPEDLLNRTDAFLASAGAQDEVFRARVAAALGLRQLDALFPAARPTRPSAVDFGAITYRLSEALLGVGTRPFFSGFAAPYVAGSNVWVVPGSRTATGRPLLAADPHRRFEAPASRYLIHLSAPGWNVAGATSPWLPGVVIGHNERVAWAMASADEDVQDLVVERVNPANDREVWRDGRWIPMTVEHEMVQVKGAKAPFEFDRLYTEHGPIVGVDRTRHLAYALRWSGAAPGTAGEMAATSLNQATSAEDFRLRLSRWKLPAADFVFADSEGIQRQRAGLVPQRSAGRGELPSAAWVNELQWTGWKTLDDLPHARESTRPLWAANGNRAREQRIQQLLDTSEPHTADRLREMQNDTVTLHASRLVPFLAALPLSEPAAKDAHAALSAWDLRVSEDSDAAILYRRWEEQLRRRLAALRMPPDLVDDAASRLPLLDLLASPSRVWFGSASRRARDELLVDALTAAREQAGNSGAPSSPRMTFLHPLAISPAARERFNVGPFQVPGDPHTILAVSRDRLVGPALRMVFDVGDWDRSTAINAPGQSGWPESPRYRDHASPWLRGEQFPLLFTPTAVVADGGETLVLEPH